MHPIMVTAVFCEDIREEKGGSVMLVGIFPDNVNLDSSPGAQSSSDARHIVKLCAYVRLHFDPSAPLSGGKMKLVLPDDNEQDLGAVDTSTLDEAREKARAAGNPMAGLVAKLILPNFFAAKRIGHLRLMLELDGKSYLAGHLNFRQVKVEKAEEATSSTAH